MSALGNERAMLQEVDAALAESERGMPWTMVRFDLEGFERCRETYGRPAGDALLTRLGSNLREAIGSTGSAFRIGGDEFCVLLCGEARGL